MAHEGGQGIVTELMTLRFGAQRYRRAGAGAGQHRRDRTCVVGDGVGHGDKLRILIRSSAYLVAAEDAGNERVRRRQYSERKEMFRMRRQRSLCLLLTGVLAGTCALSLLGNVALLQRSRHYERMFHLARLDPLGLGSFDSAPAPDMTPSTRRIVFFGDSRAAAWPAPTAPGAQILNRGIGGHSSAQALLRFEAHVAPLRPDLVVVQVGGNDLAALALLRADQAPIMAATRENVAAIVDKARGLGARVILTTIFPLARGPWPDAGVQRAIAEVNRELLGLAAADVQVLDSAAVLAGPDGYVRPAYAADELHLSAAGYAALNAALAPLLGEGS